MAPSSPLLLPLLLLLSLSLLFLAPPVLSLDSLSKSRDYFPPEFEDDIFHPASPFPGGNDVINHRSRRSPGDPGPGNQPLATADQSGKNATLSVKGDGQGEPAVAGEHPVAMVTTGQLVLLGSYVWITLWVLCMELVAMVRVLRGREPYPGESSSHSSHSSHSPHHHHQHQHHEKGDDSLSNGRNQGAASGVNDGGESGLGGGKAEAGEPGEGKIPTQASSGATVAGGSSAEKGKPVIPEGATTFIPQFNILSYHEEARKVGRAAVLFGSIILLIFIVDGPYAAHGVDNRRYDRDLFLFVCAVITLMGFLTLRDTHKKTAALLNREQTEEWKGFMQIGFVLYHYYAAKETYNLVRVFIAAYVWMTGFGNFSYFWVRRDYSFVRLAKMLIRLNWLVFFVCIVMDKAYMLYYVCPLHTFFFIVVYATMAICEEKNYEPFWMRLKFLLLFAFLYVLFEVPGVFEVFFWPFWWLLSYEDSLHEWKFRSTLDHYAVFIGMLCAYNYPAIEAGLKGLEESFSRRREVAVKVVVGLLSVGTLAWWLVYFLPMNKYEYNRLHPYVGAIPYLAYAVIRNLNQKNRTWVLGLFQWSGRITLETYIAQFHLWLVNDAKGRLVYIEGYPLMNFVVATAVYLLVSSLLFDTTVTLNDALIPPGTTSINAAKRLTFYVVAWMGISAFLSLLRIF